MRLFKREFLNNPRVVDVIVAAVVAIPTTMDAWFNVPGTRQADAITYSLVVVLSRPCCSAGAGRGAWP
jgi:hypothetical protein